MVRVLLLAASPALRAGLTTLLGRDGSLQIAGEAAHLDPTELEEAEADVLIYAPASHDPSPGEWPGVNPSTAILLLSDDPLEVQGLTRSSRRIWGILPVEASAGELLAAVHALAEGLIVADPMLLEGRSQARPQNEDAPSVSLTDREVEVLALLAQGLANKQIAATLGISEHTVKFHVSSIYTKLGVTNRTEAARQGVRGGWIAL